MRQAAQRLRITGLLRNPDAGLTAAPQADETEGVAFPPELVQHRRHQQACLETVAFGLDASRRVEYVADWFIEEVAGTGAAVVIPPKRHRREQRAYDRNLYADRNKVERLFGRLKHYRRVATRSDKAASSYLAMVQVAAIMTLLL